MAEDGNFAGKEKAAILMVSIGADNATQIFRHLKESEIEELTIQMASMKKVGDDARKMVIEDFFQVCADQGYLSDGGIDYIKEVLIKAMGVDRAADIIGKLTKAMQLKPFDFIKKADPSQLLNFIQNEHPQTIALIFSHISSQQAAGMFSALPHEKQVEVATRIARMEKTSPEFIGEVERILEKKITRQGAESYTETGGIQTVVDIFNTVDRATEKRLFEILEVKNSELADEIRARMFIFEDIIKLDNRSIQMFLKEIEQSDLALALKGATEEVFKIVNLNMSKRMQEMLQEDIEMMGPVRLRDIEEAQQKIVSVIRRLEDTEQIVTRGKGDEQFV